MKRLLILLVLLPMGCKSIAEYTANVATCESSYISQIAWEDVWPVFRTWIAEIVADPLKGLTFGTAKFFGSFSKEELLNFGGMLYCPIKYLKPRSTHKEPAQVPEGGGTKLERDSSPLSAKTPQ